MLGLFENTAQQFFLKSMNIITNLIHKYYTHYL